MVNNTRPANADVSRATAAAADAARIRASWLMALSDGRATTSDLVAAAARPDGRALRSIRLRDLLLSEHRSASTTDRALAKLRRMTSVPAERLTVGWLVDSRQGGTNRLVTFCDALVSTTMRREIITSSGWPYAPLPGWGGGQDR